MSFQESVQIRKRIIEIPKSLIHNISLLNDKKNLGIYKIYLVSFITNLQFFGAVTIPFFTEWADLNYKSIFILESFYTLFLFSTEIPNGIFADKFTRKRALFLALTCLGLGYITFSATKEFSGFVIAELLCALGAAFLSGADKALLCDLLKESNRESEVKKCLAKMQSFSTLGMALGLPLGSFFAKSNFILPYPDSLPLTFILSALGCFLVAGIVLTIKEKKPVYRKKSFIQVGYDSCKEIASNRNLFLLSLNLVLINTPSFFIVWLYQPLLSRCSIDVKYFGLVACAFNLFSIILLHLITKIEAFIGVRNLLFYSGLLPGFLFIALAFFEQSYLVIGLIIIAASIKSLRAPIMGDYINAEIGGNNRATILSAVSMMQRLFLFLLNPIVGALSDISISYSLILLGIITTSCSFIFRNKIGSTQKVIHPTLRVPKKP